ncbi:MAG: hypothetical protein ACOWWO_00360 [Peptococcaceae bacterium]
MHSVEKKIILAYQFCYRLCANPQIAEKITARVIMEKCGDDNLSLLRKMWQEFLNYYGFLQFYAENDVQKVLLLLPPELRCGVILRDIFKYNYHDIAVVLAISPKEAQYIVAQGRTKIRIHANNG